jgi:hypothetical protein
MKRRYIVQVEGFSTVEERQFIDALRSKKFSWWHRFSGFWLIIDPEGTFTPITIRDILTEINPVPLVFVMHVPPGRAAFAGTKIDDDMYSWNKLEWNKGELGISAGAGAKDVDAKAG